MRIYSTLEIEDGAAKARYWREICATVFTGLDVRPIRNDDRFDNSLKCADIGQIRISHAASMPAQIARTRAAAARADKDIYFLHLQLSGCMSAEHCGREAALRPGDLVLCEQNSPYRMVLADPARTLIVAIPGATLRSHLPSPQDVLGLKLDGRAGVSALLGPFLEQIWRQSAELEGVSMDTATRLSRSLLDLFVTAVAEACGACIGDAISAGARRLQIGRLIEEHLRDPNFGPRQIASALGASERYVRKLFEAQDETIMERLLRRRLEECAKQLSDPIWARRNVTEIAFSWGFNSSSHFARAFKNRYGFTPKAYRQRRDF